MNKYYFQEGAVLLPEYLVDGTVNLLAPRPGSLGLTIAITRDELDPGEDLDGFISRQMGDVAKQVAKFSRQPSQQATLGRAAKPNGVKFKLSYKQQGRFTYHIQAIFLVPDGAKKTLGFAFTSHAEITPEQEKLADEILASYVPHD